MHLSFSSWQGKTTILSTAELSGLLLGVSVFFLFGKLVFGFRLHGFHEPTFLIFGLPSVGVLGVPKFSTLVVLPSKSSTLGLLLSLTSNSSTLGFLLSVKLKSSTLDSQLHLA